MNIKLGLARFAATAERFVDQFRRPSDVTPEIAPYLGYATPVHLIVRGRVLGPKKERLTRPDQSRFANFRAMVRLFHTDEIADVTVTADGVSVQSDEEGYFTITLPREDQAGQVSVTVEAGGATTVCPVVVPRADAAFGIISDVDDTMILTGAYSLWRNIWTSLTGNAATRLVFPDAVRLMQRLDADANPAFFVSSSPWNFYPFLRDLMQRYDLPNGPMFLRDYGVSETQFITGTHGDHKGAAIDTIFAANPDLSFVMVGDTGQHDAHVYADAARRHPGRIIRVILRKAGPSLDKASVDRLQGAGIPVHVGPNYDDMEF